MEPLDVNSQPASEPSEQPIRQLGIIDLMLVTTLLAVQFKLRQTSMETYGDAVPMWALMPMIFAYAITMSLSLAAFFWLPMQYSRTGKFFRHPGHWILGNYAILSTGWVISIICFTFFVKTSQDSNSSFLRALGMFSVAACCLLGAILLAVAAFKLRGRWRAVVIFLFIESNISALGSVLFAIGFLDYYWGFEIASWCNTASQVVGAIAAIGIVIAVIIDFVKKVQRDWIHWIGIVVSGAILLLFPLLQFAIQYFLIRQGNQ